MYLTKIEEKDNKGLTRYVGAALMSDDEEEVGEFLADTDGIGLIIKSLYVDPYHRGQGGGTLLLEGAMEMARAAGLAFVDAFFSDEEGFTEDFFTDNGFLVSKGHPIYSLTLKNALESSLSEPVNSPVKHCVPLAWLDDEQIKKLIVHINGANYLGISIDSDTDLSYVYIDEKGEPEACVIATKTDKKGCLRIELIFNTAMDKHQNIIELMQTLLSAVKKRHDGDIKLEFVCANEKVFMFVRKFAEKKEHLKAEGYVYHASKAVY